MKHKNLLFILMLIAASSNAYSQKDTRPNIIVILADDMGYSDIGCFGSEIETPNLDKLAKGGVRMSQFYNNARCCPTRASLLTGLYPHNAGMGHMTGNPTKEPGYAGDLNDKCVSIAQVLKPTGFQPMQPVSGMFQITLKTMVPSITGRYKEGLINTMASFPGQQIILIPMV